MNLQVTLTRTEDGAVTKIKSDAGELSKKYASWDDALDEAQETGLINTVEAVCAKALPPGFPLRSNAVMDADRLNGRGFEHGKTSPAQ